MWSVWPRPVLGARLDADVGTTHGVASDHDVRTAVDVDPVGAVAPLAVLPVGRIALADDTVDDVASDQAVPRTVGRRVAVRRWQRLLVADRVDADVVDVVDPVAGDPPPVDVAVDDHGLAGAEVQVVDLVADDPQPADRPRRVAAVDRDAVGVDVEAAERLVEVAQQVHVVVGEGDRVVVPRDVDADRDLVERRRAVAADVEAADRHVGAVLDLDDAVVPVERGQPASVEHGAAADDPQVVSVLEHDPLARVGAGQQPDGATADEPVDGGLRGAQRVVAGAGRVVVPVRRDEQDARMGAGRGGGAGGHARRGEGQRHEQHAGDPRGRLHHSASRSCATAAATASRAGAR